MKKLKIFWQQQKRNPLPLVIAFTVVYLILLIVYIIRDEEEYKSKWSPVYSTYYKDETGISDFFKLLQQTNIPVSKWERPYHFLDTTKVHNIWIISPSEDYRLRDTDYIHLRKCVEKGSNLVCVTDENLYSMRDLLTTFRIFKEKEKIDMLSSIDREKVEMLHPMAWFGHVDNVSFKSIEWNKNSLFSSHRSISYFYSDTFALIPHMRIEGTQHAQVAMMHYGKGRVFLCSIVDMITNKGIREKNNSLFWLNIAKNLHISNASPIMFDEYSHGFGTEKPQDMWSPFKLPESKYVLWGLTLLFIFYARSMGKRLIKPVKVYEEPRRRVMEFVEAVANLYEKHNAHNAILADSVHRFRKHLIGYLHLSQHSSTPQIIDAYQKKHDIESAKKLSDLLNRIERTKNIASIQETTAIMQEIRNFCLRHKIEYFRI